MRRNARSINRVLAILLTLCMLIAAAPVSAESVTAQIVLETTGKPPAGGTVPMYETLLVELSDGSTPEGYQWKFAVTEDGEGFDAGTGASYLPPSRYLEQVCWQVWCEVSCGGETVVTQKVNYNMNEYPREMPVGWDTNYWNGGGDWRRMMPNPEKSNPDYVFYVDGKGFVVANERNVRGSAYFVVALDAYGDIYNGDVPGKGSSVEWKNYKGKPFNDSNDGCEGTGFAADGDVTMQTKLLGEGNTFDGLKDANGNAIEGSYALPDIFDDYIDMDHSWPILASEDGRLRSSTSGIALLGYNDFLNYRNRIGWKDNVYSKSKNPILLRDLLFERPLENDTAGRVIDSEGGVTSDTDRQYIVRPCFWLEKDFFEKNAIDLDTAGLGVLNIMKNETYTNADALKETYIAAGKEDEYNMYLNLESQLTTTVRSGADLTDVQLLDTLVASVKDGAAAEYQWQVSRDNGANWTDMEGETSAEYIVSAAQAGAQVRCTAAVNGTVLRGIAVQIPDYETIATNESITAGTVDATPDENKFTVDGKGFVLLDTFDNNESTYYVTTTEAYGDMETIAEGTDGGYENPTGKQINYDAYKSGAFLNGSFLTTGNNYAVLSDGTETYYKLPQGIIDNINQNHVWWRFVNDYRKQNGVSGTYKAGVSLLSWTDFTAYAGKFGITEVFNDDKLQFNSIEKAYYLRDTHTWGGDSAVVVFRGGNAPSFVGVNAQRAGLLRPAFYLKKDFFKTTKIDLPSMGENVKTAIRAACTDPELLRLYGADDCKMYFGMDVDVAFIELSLRSGKNIGNAELLDTVTVTVENAVANEFWWEISEDGNEWYKAENAEGDSFILTAEYAGKMLRCTAVSNGTEIRSSTLKIPNPKIMTPPNGNSNTFVETTPDAYRFMVDGKGFVLLDAFDNDESAFYVTTTEAYGDMKLITDGDFENPTGKQVNYDAYISDAFLNKDFLTKGNNFSALSNDATTYYKLPQEIIDNINQNHVWWRFVNDYRKENGVQSTYKTGVSFLSWTDFTMYAGKFGVLDVFRDDNLKDANVYFLRDTNNWGGDSALAVFGGEKYGKNCTFMGQYVEASGLLRPAFYLKNAFFKTVKLDLSETGEAVLDMMRDKYSIEDLNGVYSEEELTTKGFMHRYSMQASYTLCNDTRELESLAGVPSIQANVTIRNSVNSNTDALLLLAVYNENGKMIKIAKQEVTLKAQSDMKSSVAITSLPDGVTDKYKISVMLWDSVDGMYSFTGGKLTFDNKGR